MTNEQLKLLLAHNTAHSLLLKMLMFSTFRALRAVDEKAAAAVITGIRAAFKPATAATASNEDGALEFERATADVLAAFMVDVGQMLELDQATPTVVNH